MPLSKVCIPCKGTGLKETPCYTKHCEFCDGTGRTSEGGKYIDDEDRPLSEDELRKWADRLARMIGR